MTILSIVSKIDLPGSTKTKLRSLQKESPGTYHSMQLTAQLSQKHYKIRFTKIKILRIKVMCKLRSSVRNIRTSSGNNNN